MIRPATTATAVAELPRQIKGDIAAFIMGEVLEKGIRRGNPQTDIDLELAAGVPEDVARRHSVRDEHEPSFWLTVVYGALKNYRPPYNPMHS